MASISLFSNLGFCSASLTEVKRAKSEPQNYGPLSGREIKVNSKSQERRLERNEYDGPSRRKGLAGAGRVGKKNELVYFPSESMTQSVWRAATHGPGQSVLFGLCLPATFSVVEYTQCRSMHVACESVHMCT